MSRRSIESDVYERLYVLPSERARDGASGGDDPGGVEGVVKVYRRRADGSAAGADQPAPGPGNSSGAGAGNAGGGLDDPGGARALTPGRRDVRAPADPTAQSKERARVEQPPGTVGAGASAGAVAGHAASGRLGDGRPVPVWAR